MFGFGMGLPTVGTDPEKERSLPASPEPLDFPIYDLSDTTEQDAEAALKDLYNVLTTIQRPQDITTERFSAFNLKVESDVPASRIVRQDDTSSAPPLPWEDTPEQKDGPPPLLSNENPYPDRRKFEEIKNELLLDNDDAFQVVAPIPHRQARRIRIAQSRKFWAGLEWMAQYWDTSLDNYYQRPATPDGDEMQAEENAHESKAQSNAEPGLSIHVNKPTTQANGNGTSILPERPLVTKYTGRRIGSGDKMPENAREDTVRAFAEMVAWAFGCRINQSALPQRLAVKTLLFPVRVSFEAGRSPQDQQVARSGILEGPLFFGQCRNETTFRTPEDQPGSGLREICDLFGEVGTMLLGAQERMREGTTEVRPGEGKWWTTVPRWGGAPNEGTVGLGHFGGIDGSNDSNKGQPSKHSRYDYPSLARRPSQKVSNVDKWKIVQPGPSLWDKRMRYIRVGKSDSPFDDIYMLSSINHHVSILHLHVHRRYLETVTKGQSNFPPESDTPDQPWYELKLRRTQWYDLFSAQDRVEAFESVWRVFHYLMRKVG